MSKPIAISPGSRVVMNFSLALEDGTEVLSTFEDEPLEFTLGDGIMEPALEAKLIGLETGDDQTLLLDGDDVYGPWRENNRQWLELNEFPSSLEPEEGHVIAFTTPGGEEIAGIIVTLEADRVLVDFNHPLSGKTFIFRAVIIGLVDPHPIG
ncbi:MAG: FKBP-type peptidyl-prolyl cis-trans isomerase [Candidatus Thiodiazotropha sp.]